MSPARIQRRRSKGWRMPENTIYVGRGSKWGNPYVVGKTQIRMPALNGDEWEVEGRLHKPSGEKVRFYHPDNTVTWHQVEDATPEQCVQLFREYITGTFGKDRWRFLDKTDAIRAELRGKNLACWCPLDRPCHADVLLELANKKDLP